MPRLSLWKPEQANDYKFFDKTIREMYTVGGTDLLVHKYLGANNPADSEDFTQPHYDALRPENIQDLLFLENRDRVYGPYIYRIRGHYNVANLDFDLSQFGLFLSNDVIFVTVHYNDMIDIIGRKLMVGDVFELPHLTDYHPLNDAVPVGLRRFYQITDANYASEGFSQTWYPHLWRIKCEPLVDSQEFANILQDPINKDNYLGDWDKDRADYVPGYTVTWRDKIYTPIKPVPPGISPDDPEYWTISSEQNLIDILSTYNKNIAVNNAAIEEAKRVVPLSGYDRSQLYVVPTFVDNQPAPPINVIVPSGSVNTLVVGKVEYVASSEYKTASPIIRLSSNNNLNYSAHTVTSLQIRSVVPELAENGSGQVFPDIVLSATPIGPPFTVPYGTADNTYSTADQYVKFNITALFARQNSTTISIQDMPEEVRAGLVIRCVIFSSNGTPQDIFSADTTIISVDRINSTITTSSATRGAIAAGTELEISYDFVGTVEPWMDYRADCDPRFQFIKRSSPRSFGYLNGYLVGTTEAPNGEPTGAGVTFPVSPAVGDYFLRIDYLPQKLFRFDGRRWVEISRNVRTDLGLGFEDQSQLSRFINDADRTQVAPEGTVPTRQSLSKALRVKPDQ